MSAKPIPILLALDNYPVTMKLASHYPQILIRYSNSLINYLLVNILNNCSNQSINYLLVM